MQEGKGMQGVWGNAIIKSHDKNKNRGKVMQNEKHKQRLYWLDTLKGLAILAVVVGHLLNGFLNHQLFPTSTDTLRLFRNWIYTWHMPFFMMLSGFSFFTAYEKDGEWKQDKIRYQIKNLFLLYVLFSVVLEGLKLLFGASAGIGSALRNAICPDNIFWYLWVLIIYQLLFGVCGIARTLKRESRYAFVVVFTGCLAVAWDCLAKKYSWRLGMTHLLYELPFFILGLWLAYRYRKGKTLPYVAAAVYVCAFTAGYLLFYGCYRQLLPALQVSLRFLYAVTLSMLLVAAAGGWRLSNRNFLCYLGKNSLVIYLTHKYVITIYDKILSHFAVWPLEAGLLIGMIACLAVPLLIAELAKKIKPLWYLFHPAELLKKDAADSQKPPKGL